MVACGEPGRGITKVHEPSFGGYGSVYYLDCGDCFTGIYISQNLSMALLIINNTFIKLHCSKHFYINAVNPLQKPMR